MAAFMVVSDELNWNYGNPVPVFLMAFAAGEFGFRVFAEHLLVGFVFFVHGLSDEFGLIADLQFVQKNLKLFFRPPGDPLGPLGADDHRGHLMRFIQQGVRQIHGILIQ